MQAGRGVTLTLTLEDPALRFVPSPSGGMAEGVVLSAEGGLAGLNVFLADARLDEGGALRLTVIATEARMNQPAPAEAGRVRLSLPVAGLNAGESTSAACACGGVTTSVTLRAADARSDAPEAAGNAPDLNRSGEGLTDYASRGTGCAWPRTAGCGMCGWAASSTLRWTTAALRPAPCAR